MDPLLTPKTEAGSYTNTFNFIHCVNHYEYDLYKYLNRGLVIRHNIYEYCEILYQH